MDSRASVGSVWAASTVRPREVLAPVALLDLPLPAVLIDSAGVIRFASHAAEVLLKVRPGGLTDTPLELFMPSSPIGIRRSRSISPRPVRRSRAVLRSSSPSHTRPDASLDTPPDTPQLARYRRHERRASWAADLLAQNEPARVRTRLGGVVSIRLVSFELPAVFHANGTTHAFLFLPM